MLLDDVTFEYAEHFRLSCHFYFITDVIFSINFAQEVPLAVDQWEKIIRILAYPLWEAIFEKCTHLDWPGAFRLLTDNGPKTVLSAGYADEIRSHPLLNFGAAIAKEFHADIKGFDTFKQGTRADEIFQDAVRMQLTHHLGNVIEPISTEASIILERDWTNNHVLEERRQAKEAAIRVGKTPERYLDAMQWLEESARGRYYDPVVAQLSFSHAAIHTTSDLLTQVLFNLCGREELTQKLRDEIITVTQAEGLKKTTLFKLKLMDSVLKETQRLKPVAVGESIQNSLCPAPQSFYEISQQLFLTTMRRLAEEDIELSDKTFIPKGELIVVACDKMWDPDTYPNPSTFDPYRFVKFREKPGHEMSAQLVSTSPEHLGFGFGKHTCPGRFFAATLASTQDCSLSSFVFMFY
ncbi:conserved hypothetical protein [Histoplasma mississippiense (nom. inval.)]|uniref:conserved hypothetical protein n=1 Tax=Ajellomyces capsulatus (strain NAm1 / WU24) TaxID=2059318 RepID=UPI000157D2FB|nr:conserved hypothetical protein [Histoplasma mississippiense (nom. inval.)]EDN04903.1 conserved hypothetical protein [Histoplasma mississippiense (nom. inval.)]